MALGSQKWKCCNSYLIIALGSQCAPNFITLAAEYMQQLGLITTHNELLLLILIIEQITLELALVVSRLHEALFIKIWHGVFSCRYVSNWDGGAECKLWSQRWPVWLWLGMSRSVRKVLYKSWLYSSRVYWYEQSKFDIKEL